MSTRFQSFEDPIERAGSKRVALLREELRHRGLDGFVVPRSDEHQSEYVPPCEERLAWLTGFTGSAGTAIVLLDQVGLVVDGRYTLQAATQTDRDTVTVVPLADTTAEAWIETNLRGGAALGYDPRLTTSAALEKLRKAVDKAGGKLVATDGNPVDAVWTDRPPPPCAPVAIRPDDLAGESATDKLARVRTRLGELGADALLVSDPHNLAWTFNLRGGDVAHTPLALGYAIVPRDGRPSLFLDAAKVSNEVGAALGSLADLTPPEALTGALERLGRSGRHVRIDSATGAAAFATLVKGVGSAVDSGPDPITALKAVKNAAEIGGARSAHRRDGAAYARFLHWLARAPCGSVTEIAAVETLEDFRRETGALRDVSFPTISGSGPNGAIVHYRVSRSTNRAVQAGELFLVDSGAQYEDGTTDITRTVAIGEPEEKTFCEMRDRYTRVLKGHVAISRAVFPKGSSGAQLDSFARAPLWQIGADFDHGTGHGVGAYLSVHEGPQRISKLGTATLEPGMILSNEPGYYKQGEYGIRIENLVLVEPREISGGERPMLGFETLTLAPYERVLIDLNLLDAGEIAWIDSYHERVRRELTRLVPPEVGAWLAEATRPLQAGQS